MDERAIYRNTTLNLVFPLTILLGNASFPSHMKHDMNPQVFFYRKLLRNHWLEFPVTIPVSIHEGNMQIFAVLHVM